MKTKNYYDVVFPVLIRKYEVDIERLKVELKSHKIPKEILAEKLDKPITLVEHWFRNDKYFAIPTPDIWFQLKELLGVKTDMFDKSIMTFVEGDSKFDSNNRIYFGDTSPTLSTMCGEDYYLIKNENTNRKKIL